MLASVMRILASIFAVLTRSNGAALQATARADSAEADLAAVTKGRDAAQQEVAQLTVDLAAAQRQLAAANGTIAELRVQIARDETGAQQLAAAVK